MLILLLKKPLIFFLAQKISKAHSKYFADAAYAKLKAPKREIVVPGATHTDLYDQMDKIPFDDLVQFFDDALK